MDIQQKGIITLVRSALNSERLSLPQDFDLEAAVAVAKKHQISVMLYYGALNCGIPENIPVMQELFNVTCKNIVISQGQLYGIDSILSAFEANGIEHMPLKGTLLKKIYPKPEMRTMSDADILIHHEEYDDKIKGIMTDLGFAEGKETDHELHWHSPALFAEIHKRIIPSYNKDFYEYFGDGWRLAKRIEEDSYRYAMNEDDQLIYLFTHLAKHYRNGGIGIKHFTDLWVYKKSATKFNDEYIESELKKLKLFEFYTNVMNTIDVWFKDVEPNPKTELITDYVFSSGAYGTVENRTIADGVKVSKVSNLSARKSKFIKIRNLIFLPYSGMCIKYPVVKKAPILLPVFWVVRWCDTIINKSANLKKLDTNINAMSVKSIENFADALDYVGLDFNFEE